MAHKGDLRKQRTNTVINRTSKKQQDRLGIALQIIQNKLVEKFQVKLAHENSWNLKELVAILAKRYPDVEFHCYRTDSSMRPDGGILSILDEKNVRYPILITELKNQGTNDLRLVEGKTKQAKGNAIERLGKNVIGFRVAFLHESIFPFVCFGDGCDFDVDSSILDRVVTIAMFGKLNRASHANEGPNGVFNRGSFFFRVPLWTTEEMAPIMYDIAERSIHYYMSRYGETTFLTK